MKKQRQITTCNLLKIIEKIDFITCSGHIKNLRPSLVWLEILVAYATPVSFKFRKEEWPYT